MDDFEYTFHHPGEASYRNRETGEVICRFDCSPLVCGCYDCEPDDEVMMNIRPLGWHERKGFVEGNPYDLEFPDWTKTFFVGSQTYGYRWNEAVWGEEPEG